MRHELGWKGCLTAIAVWTGLLLGSIYAGLSPYIFIVAQVLLDIVLILVVFGGDIRIR